MPIWRIVSSGVSAQSVWSSFDHEAVSAISPAGAVVDLVTHSRDSRLSRSTTAFSSGEVQVELLLHGLAGDVAEA